MTKAKAAAKRSGKRTRKSAPTTSPKTKRRTHDEDAFAESLIAHGQAVKVAEGGKLPPGATHEIVEDEHGHRRVVRRRFSAY